MSFGAPIWFWALAILPVLVSLYVRGEQRSSQLLRGFVAARLLPQLAGNIDRFRRGLRFAFVLLAIALAIVALAKPRWGYTYEDVKRRGLDLLIAVDTSRSMLSNDVAPSRLDRVKLAAQDLISELNGDRAGLIAFAGRAFLQAPLTVDYDAAVESITDLDTKTIPEGGTNISGAIALAVSTFGKSAMGNRALIIFTDGEDLNGDAVEEAKKAAEAGVRIFTVGVGTPQGSLIPVEIGFVKDLNGQVVKSKLDEKRLQEIAAATGGDYRHLESGPATMRALYRDGLAKMQASEIDDRLAQRPIEHYEWPLGASIIALIVSLFINDRKRARAASPRTVKRAALAAAAVLLMALPPAFGVSGLDLYKQGQYDQAYSQFQEDLKRSMNPADAGKMRFDEGAAAYKLGKYDDALEAFSQALVDRSPVLQEKSHYNLGKTLEDRADLQQTTQDALRDLENAKSHYEGTLKLNPDNKAAAERLEIVKKKIEQLKKHPKQPSPPPQNPQQNKKDQKNDQDQNQQQQQGGQSQQQAKNNQQQPKNDNSQNQQQPNQEQKPDSSNKNQSQQQQQNNSQDKQGDQQKDNGRSSPSPSPKGDQKRDEKKQQRPGESPTPSLSQQGPSPSPGENGTSPSASPSPSAGDGGEGQSPSPTPNGSPEKPRSGEIKGAGQPSQEQANEQAAAEAEAEKKGEMTPKQAERLLQAMKGEEARVQLDERRSRQRVYKDW